MTDDLDARKQSMRRAALARRETCDPRAGAVLAKRVIAEWPPPAGAVVAGFWPMGQEIDIRPLLQALHAAGHVVVLPETTPRGQPLRFRCWTPVSAMIGERFGTSRPDGDERRPDVLYVPLLAFDRTGARLGYGAGYYDRTLAGLPGALAIGCAYAAQEVEAVPTGPTDIRLAGIATERFVLRFAPR